MADPDRPEERQALYEKLSAELSIVSWSALSPHAERGALFWVDKQLDLVEVAMCMALDEAVAIGAWHEAGLLLPAAQNAPPDFAAFRFLIVQPFVLATPLELPNGVDAEELNNSTDEVVH